MNIVVFLTTYICTNNMFLLFSLISFYVAIGGEVRLLWCWAVEYSSEGEWRIYLRQRLFSNRNDEFYPLHE